MCPCFSAIFQTAGRSSPDAALEAAKKQVDAAKANVSSLSANVSFSNIYAPFSGTIGISNVKTGTAIVTVQDTVRPTSELSGVVSTPDDSFSYLDATTGNYYKQTFAQLHLSADVKCNGVVKKTKLCADRAFEIKPQFKLGLEIQLMAAIDQRLQG